MRKPLGDLLGLVFLLIDLLEESSIDYAFGGAIAYSAWAEPRATRDVDLNVWLDSGDLPRLFSLFDSSDIRTDREKALRDAAERGMFEARYGEIRIDVFLPSVAFYQSVRERRRRVSFDSRQTWVLSPEALAVFKMLFHRPKDFADIQRMLELQGARFDHLFVRRALVEMLGENDQRVKEWDELKQRIAPSSG